MKVIFMSLIFLLCKTAAATICLTNQSAPFDTYKSIAIVKVVSAEISVETSSQKEGMVKRSAAAPRIETIDSIAKVLVDVKGTSGSEVRLVSGRTMRGLSHPAVGGTYIAYLNESGTAQLGDCTPSRKINSVYSGEIKTKKFNTRLKKELILILEDTVKFSLNRTPTTGDSSLPVVKSDEKRQSNRLALVIQRNSKHNHPILMEQLRSRYATVGGRALIRLLQIPIEKMMGNNYISLRRLELIFEDENGDLEDLVGVNQLKRLQERFTTVVNSHNEKLTPVQRMGFYIE